MRRRIVILVLCLLAGAVINVLVAWGFALWGHPKPQARTGDVPLGWKLVNDTLKSTVRVWGMNVPASWPPPTQIRHLAVYESRGTRVVDVIQSDMRGLKIDCFGESRPLKSAALLRHSLVSGAAVARRADPQGGHTFQSVIRWRTGWPMRSMQWGQWADDSVVGFAPAPGLDAGLPVPNQILDTWNGIDRRLPIRPLSFAFATNTVVDAGMIWLTGLSFTYFRQRHRRKHQRCERCNYELCDLTTCPECGTPSNANDTKDSF